MQINGDFPSPFAQKHPSGNSVHRSTVFGRRGWELNQSVEIDSCFRLVLPPSTRAPSLMPHAALLRVTTVKPVVLSLFVTRTNFKKGSFLALFAKQKAQKA